MKGIEFVERWYHAVHVPAELTKLYQLLLKLIWMKGVMEARLAQKLGFSALCIGLAESNDYVKITRIPVRPPEEVQRKIADMIGKAPRWIYA